MLPCKEDNFATDKTITLTNSAVTDSDILDWHQHGNDIDKLLRLFILNKQTAASAGAATLTIAFLTSADGTTWTTLRTYAAIALATLAEGAVLLNNEALPDGLLRYNKLTFTVGGANFTTSPKIDAIVTPNDHFIER